MQTIQIKNQTITYNFEKIIERINNLTFREEEEDYNERDKISPKNEAEFSKLKQEFLQNVLSIQTNFQYKLETLHYTAKGLLAKNRNHILQSSGICSNYNDWYGSHQYDELCLCIDYTGTLVLQQVKCQDPF